MALYKEIEQQNGIITNYHRVVSVNIITNIHNIIEIASYTSQQKREEELDSIKNKTGCNVFIETTLKMANYNQNMTVEDAYKWLKTLPDFDDAEDI